MSKQPVMALVDRIVGLELRVEAQGRALSAERTKIEELEARLRAHGENIPLSGFSTSLPMVFERIPFPPPPPPATPQFTIAERDRLTARVRELEASDRDLRAELAGSRAYGNAMYTEIHRLHSIGKLSGRVSGRVLEVAKKAETEAHAARVALDLKFSGSVDVAGASLMASDVTDAMKKIRIKDATFDGDALFEVKS